MKHAKPSMVAWLLLTLATISLGCGRTNNAGPKMPPTRAIMNFKSQYAPTITAHGKVMQPTLEERADYIHYRTEDGKAWRVHWKVLPDDEYQFGTPESVDK